MAYNIELFEAAKDDFNDAIDWYVAQSVPTARRFVDSFQEILDRLTDNPAQFPKAKEQVRKARFSPPFPYNAYFFVKDDTVFIVSLFHDSRNPAIWQRRA